MRWTAHFFQYLDKGPEGEVSQQEISDYLTQQSKHCQQWQVEQASEAIHLFLYYRRRKHLEGQKEDTPERLRWKLLADDMVRLMRLKHLSINTERSYLSWIRVFYRFLAGKAPDELDSIDVKDFLTHLAAERRVSPSSQNQAFNAILFFYRFVLRKQIEDLDGTFRARRKRRLPVVLTKQEVQTLFTHLKGTPWLMARLIYGSGLRLQECLNLRIKDIDFNRRRVVVIQGKGGKDRETVLPDTLRHHLQSHLQWVYKLYLADRKNDVPGVYLPHALERKYPNGGKEWRWQWVFPAPSLSLDPRTKIIRRHHVYPDTIQRQLRSAVHMAKIPKRVTVHCL